MAEGSASSLEHDIGPTGSGHVHTTRTRPGRRTALDAHASGAASRPRAHRGAVPEQSKSGEERVGSSKVKHDELPGLAKGGGLVGSDGEFDPGSG